MNPRRKFGWPTVALTVVVALATAVTSCGNDASSAGNQAPSDTDVTRSATADEVRLGFFPNVTHAPALVGQVARVPAQGVENAERGLAREDPHARQGQFVECLGLHGADRV